MSNPRSLILDSEPEVVTQQGDPLINLFQHGWAVVKNVSTKSNAQHALNKIKSIVDEVENIKYDNSGQALGIGSQTDFMWKGRLSSRLFFERLWDYQPDSAFKDERIVTSLESFRVGEKSKIDLNTNSKIPNGFDQNKYKGKMVCVRGLIQLTNNSGITFGSYGVDPTYKKQTFITPFVEEGDMIIWDIRLPTFFRPIVEDYGLLVCMYPVYNKTKVITPNLIEEGIQTSFWALTNNDKLKVNNYKESPSMVVSKSTGSIKSYSRTNLVDITLSKFVDIP